MNPRCARGRMRWTPRWATILPPSSSRHAALGLDARRLYTTGRTGLFEQWLHIRMENSLSLLLCDVQSVDELDTPLGAARHEWIVRSVHDVPNVDRLQRAIPHRSM